ncbi:hypothetical protein KR51_00034120 [Rubidibacter lacunae KORDI 51-2]|uniref:Uncharacterized protein n=1 Tax=Rubidibacter lacunae KORDI 51-2 TaxID=582515 RepID=U5D666_9CHRO|nr:hypothetical protein KR51_00034120 [Rubidibacter lacunae KORDI 51-2]
MSNFFYQYPHLSAEIIYYCIWLSNSFPQCFRNIEMMML